MPDASLPHPPGDSLLDARDLTVSVAGDAGRVTVLDRVSLRLGPGDIVDVVGPSGSGKTTLLRTLAILLPGATGILRLREVTAEKIGPIAWRSRVALLPQKPAIVAGTVRANLLLPWTLKAREEHQPPSEALMREGLDELALIDIALDRDAARLSVGQQARIALLRVLLTGPDVLLLDEPDAALDDASAGAVRERLRAFAEGGGAVVRVRHRADDGLAARRLRLAEGVLEEVAR